MIDPTAIQQLLSERRAGFSLPQAFYVGEDLFQAEARAGHVRTFVLRAGDFFGGTGKGSWFDQVMGSKVAKGTYTAAGLVDIVHGWAYLPDLAKTFVALADKRDMLGSYEALHFAGHSVTDLQMKAAAERVVGRRLKLAQLPWWLLRAGAPFIPMWRALVSMSYLRFEPHRLVSGRLERIIGSVPHTALDQAVADALSDMGVEAAGDRQIKLAA